MLRSLGPIWDKIRVSESAGVTYLSVLEDSREHAPGHPRWPYLFVEPRAIQIQAFLILLHFADTVFCFFFTHGKFVATLCQASLLLSFFQRHLLTLGLHETFWSFSQYFRLFHYCYGVL